MTEKLTEQITFRLDGSALAVIDRGVEQLRRETGLRVSRSDMARKAVEAWAAAQYGGKPARVR